MRIANNNYVSFGGCSTPAQMIDVCGGIVASTNICAVKFLENGTCLAGTYAPILSPNFSGDKHPFFKTATILSCPCEVISKTLTSFSIFERVSVFTESTFILCE